VAERNIRVECYSGYKADERPMRLHLGERVLEITAIEDRWYSPGEEYFRVLTSDGDRYVLRHVEAQDVWSLTAYRAGQTQPH
jgi:hypothetical protein